VIVSDDGQQPRRPSRFVEGVPMGRVLGVPLVVQPIWFVVLITFTFVFEPTVRDRAPGVSYAATYAVALLFVLLLYGSVLVHEISHVVVAKSLGMEVRRIVLQLLGGVSEVVEEQPGSARREYLVAVAGPMASLLLAAIGYGVRPLFAADSLPRLLADAFAVTNLVVAGFNALPGLPLDGGRVLRAAVWQITRDKTRATLVAGWVGRGLAVAVLAYAMLSPGRIGSSSGFGNLYLVIVAWFIWSNASIAIAQAKVTGVLPLLDVRGMTRRAMPVTAELPVAEAVRRAREAGARALVVVDSLGKPSGLVSEAAVSALPPQRQPWVSVSDLARPVEDGLVLRTDMAGDRLLQMVQATPATEYLVLEPTGTVCGVLARVDLVAALQAAGLR
jgi:Zn-dependent protease/CBS domain-containing protein